MVEIFSEWRRQFDLARTPYDARVALGVAFFNTSADLPGGPYQAEDGDLTAISGLTGTNTIYYRSGDEVWTPVTMGANMTFTAGILNSIASGVTDAPVDGNIYGRKDAAWANLLGGSGIEEAPYDANTYGRYSGTWVPIATSVTDAPSDTYYYGRQNGYWQKVVEEAPLDDGYYSRRNGTWQVDPGGVGGGQPLDGDLTAISALTGTNTIYYRSGTDTWTAVTIGSNLTFSGGVLAATGGGGGITDAPSDSKTYGRKNAAWVDLALAYQPLDADLTSLAAASGTNTIYYRSAANTWSAVTIGGNMTFSAGVLNAVSGGGGGITDAPSDAKVYGRLNATWTDLGLLYQPLDADLTSLAAASGTNTIYYRSAANTWSPVTIGGNLTFTSGTLNAPALDADLTALAAASGTNTIYYRSAANTWSPVTMGGNMTFSGGTLNSTGGSGGGFTTGDAKLTFKTVADSGWVMMDNGSIGDASSGATTRANADTSALFTLLFNNITDTYAPMLTSDGFTVKVRADFASAAAAFAAHTRLTMPHQLGRILAVGGDGTADGVGSHALGEWDYQFTSGSSLGITFWNIMIKL